MIRQSGQHQDAKEQQKRDEIQAKTIKVKNDEQDTMPLKGWLQLSATYMQLFIRTIGSLFTAHKVIPI